MGLAIIVMLEEVHGAMHPGAFKLLAAGGAAYLGGIPCFLIGENVGEIVLNPYRVKTRVVVS